MTVFYKDYLGNVTVATLYGETLKSYVKFAKDYNVTLYKVTCILRKR